MRKVTVLIAAVCVLAAFATLVSGCKFLGLGTETKPQTMCPVMNKPIDKTQYIDYDGKRIYFCCPGCDYAFLKEPKMYEKNLQGVECEKCPKGAPMSKMQDMCPVTAMKADKQFHTDYAKRRIYFCTKACIDEFNKTPDKYMKKLQEKGQICEPAPEK